ncbi:uncharacterized protein LOC134564838 [Prinia subflava]|uniref:uncharacterized protein LOC134564838 n=1 Tax=Prinia subflava TaxID=208062 RepID=UPI002FE1FD52
MSSPLPGEDRAGAAPLLALPRTPPPCCFTRSRPAPPSALPASSSFTTPPEPSGRGVSCLLSFSLGASERTSGDRLTWPFAVSITSCKEEHTGAAFPLTGCVEFIPKNLATLDGFFSSFVSERDTPESEGGGTAPYRAWMAACVARRSAANVCKELVTFCSLCPRSFFTQLLELAVGSSFQFWVINHLPGSQLASPQQTHNKPPVSRARHSRDDAGRFVPMCCLLLLTKPLVWMFPQNLLFHESMNP